MALRRNTWRVHFYSANFIINIRWCCCPCSPVHVSCSNWFIGLFINYFLSSFSFLQVDSFNQLISSSTKKSWNFHYIENSWIVLETFDHFSEWCGRPEQDWWECWNENKIFCKYPWKRKKLTRRSWLVFLWTLTTCPYCNFLVALLWTGHSNQYTSTRLFILSTPRNCFCCWRLLQLSCFCKHSFTMKISWRTTFLRLFHRYFFFVCSRFVGGVTGLRFPNMNSTKLAGQMFKRWSAGCVFVSWVPFFGLSIIQWLVAPFKQFYIIKNKTLLK